MMCLGGIWSAGVLRHERADRGDNEGDTGGVRVWREARVAALSVPIVRTDLRADLESAPLGWVDVSFEGEIADDSGLLVGPVHA